MSKQVTAKDILEMHLPEFHNMTPFLINRICAAINEYASREVLETLKELPEEHCASCYELTEYLQRLSNGERPDKTYIDSLLLKFKK